MKHAHCWHPTGVGHEAEPREWREICCRCGGTRTGSRTWARPDGHGPFLPEDAIEMRLEYSAVIPAGPRPVD